LNLALLGLNPFWESATSFTIRNPTSGFILAFLITTILPTNNKVLPIS
jgi:hypothetical protein